MQLNGARILLTGATGGFGQALARQLAGAGARILLAGLDSAADIARWRHWPANSAAATNPSPPTSPRPKASPRPPGRRSASASTC